MKNILLNIGNTASGYTMLNAQQIIPNELLDQLIKLAAAIITAVLSNWLVNKANKPKRKKKQEDTDEQDF